MLSDSCLISLVVWEIKVRICFFDNPCYLLFISGSVTKTWGDIAHHSCVKNAPHFWVSISGPPIFDPSSIQQDTDGDLTDDYFFVGENAALAADEDDEEEGKSRANWCFSVLIVFLSQSWQLSCMVWSRKSFWAHHEQEFYYAQYRKSVLRWTWSTHSSRSAAICIGRRC